MVSFLSSVATSGCGRKPRPQLPRWLEVWVRRGAAGRVTESELFYHLNRKPEMESLGWSMRTYPAAFVVLPFYRTRSLCLIMKEEKNPLTLSPKLTHLLKFSHAILFCSRSTYICPQGRIKDWNTPQITLEHASNNKVTEKEQGQTVPWRQGWLKLEMSWRQEMLKFCGMVLFQFGMKTNFFGEVGGNKKKVWKVCVLWTFLIQGLCFRSG